MSISTVYHMVSVKRNLAVTAQKSGQSCVLEKQGDGENQRWVVEYSDDVNRVAIKSVANNEYLRVDPKTESITTGEKYIWAIWDGDDPTIYRSAQLHALSIRDRTMYLEDGKSGNRLSLYRNVTGDGREAAEFYFKSTSVNTIEKRVFGHDRLQAAEQDKKTKEMQDRQAKLEQKEKEQAAEWERKLKELEDRQKSSAKAEQDRATSFDAKVKTLEDRDAALTQKDNDRSAEWDKMMEDLQNRQKSLAQAEEDRAASLERNTKDLQARELRLAEKERQADAHLADHHKSDEDIRKAQAQQEVDLQRKIDELETTEQKVAADRAALHKSKADFAAKEKVMQQAQKELEDQRSATEHDLLVARLALKQEREEFEATEQQVATDRAALADFTAKEKTMQQGQKELEVQRSAAEDDLSSARIALEQERKEFESQKASAANEAKACTRKHASVGQDDSLNKAVIGRMQLDNAKLEQRLAKLEHKLALTSTPAATEKKKSLINGHVKGSAANGVGATGCGHKLYKPPRKLNRKLIGLIYE